MPQFEVTWTVSTYFWRSGLSERSPEIIVEQLLKASSIYNGHLFEEKLELEWIAEERERVQQQYIQLLERLAQTYTRLREFGKTISWAEKILAHRLYMGGSLQVTYVCELPIAKSSPIGEMVQKMQSMYLKMN